jgi:hypothetical protein
LSFGSGAEAVAEAYLFCEITAKGRLLEERAVFDVILEQVRGNRELVHRLLAEQPAFSSGLLRCRKPLRSIAVREVERLVRKESREEGNSILQKHALVLELDAIEVKRKGGVSLGFWMRNKNSGTAKRQAQNAR